MYTSYIHTRSKFPMMNVAKVESPKCAITKNDKCERGKIISHHTTQPLTFLIRLFRGQLAVGDPWIPNCFCQSFFAQLRANKSGGTNCNVLLH